MNLKGSWDHRKNWRKDKEVRKIYFPLLSKIDYFHWMIVAHIFNPST